MELTDGEKGKTFIGVIGQSIDAEIITERSKFDRVKEVEFRGSTSSRSGLTGCRGQDGGGER